jgi:hypothetical protein
MAATYTWTTHKYFDTDCNSKYFYTSVTMVSIYSSQMPRDPTRNQTQVAAVGV